MDLKLVIAGGLFSLGGVILGGLLTPLTQLFLERKRERRAADRTKLLVAGELLQAQTILRSVCALRYWPPIEDRDALLPTSAWRENRSSIAGMVSDDLFSQLVLAYTLLEQDRARFTYADTLPPKTPFDDTIAQGLEKLSNDLGRLRRQLGVRGGFPEGPPVPRTAVERNRL